MGTAAKSMSHASPPLLPTQKSAEPEITVGMVHVTPPSWVIASKSGRLIKDPRGPRTTFVQTTSAFPWPHAVMYSLSSRAFEALTFEPTPCATRIGPAHVLPPSWECETSTSALVSGDDACAGTTRAARPIVGLPAASTSPSRIDSGTAGERRKLTRRRAVMAPPSSCRAGAPLRKRTRQALLIHLRWSLVNIGAVRCARPNCRRVGPWQDR